MFMCGAANSQHSSTWPLSLQVSPFLSSSADIVAVPCGVSVRCDGCGVGVLGRCAAERSDVQYVSPLLAFCVYSEKEKWMPGWLRAAKAS